MCSHGKEPTVLKQPCVVVVFLFVCYWFVVVVVVYFLLVLFLASASHQRNYWLPHYSGEVTKRG